MMNHKQCIAIIALILVIAGGFLYRHYMMCKSESNVKIQSPLSSGNRKVKVIAA